MGPPMRFKIPSKGAGLSAGGGGEARAPCDGLRGGGVADGILVLYAVARDGGCAPEGSNRGGRRGGAVGGYGSRPVVGGSNSGAGAAVEQWRGAVATPASNAMARGFACVSGSCAAGGSGSGAACGCGRGAVGEMGRSATCARGRGTAGAGARGAGGTDRRGAFGIEQRGVVGIEKRGATGVAGREKLNCGGAGVGWERRLGGDRSPSRGLRIEHEENDDFDENWSPWEQRAWLMKQRVGFDKSRLTAPEFVFDSGDGERRLAAGASGSLNFRPSIINGASFVGSYSRAPEDGVLNEARDAYDSGDSNDSGSNDGDSEVDSASEDIEDEDVRYRRDF